MSLDMYLSKITPKYNKILPKLSTVAEAGLWFTPYSVEIKEADFLPITLAVDNLRPIFVGSAAYAVSNLPPETKDKDRALKEFPEFTDSIVGGITVQYS